MAKVFLAGPLHPVSLEGERGTDSANARQEAQLDGTVALSGAFRGYTCYNIYIPMR
jgi:hypothetical protein